MFNMFDDKIVPVDNRPEPKFQLGEQVSIEDNYEIWVIRELQWYFQSGDREQGEWRYGMNSKKTTSCYYKTKTKLWRGENAIEKLYDHNGDITISCDNQDPDVEPRKPVRMTKEGVPAIYNKHKGEWAAMEEMCNEEASVTWEQQTRINDLESENKELQNIIDINLSTHSKALIELARWKKNCQRAENAVKQLSRMEIDLGKIRAAIGSIEFDRIVNQKDD